MKGFKILEVKEKVFKNNDEQADLLRKELKDQGVLLINLMSSPGGGKTTLLCDTINRLRDKMEIGIMEADIDSDVDAKTISNTGTKVIQLHTGGMCHLDASMTRQGLEGLGLETTNSQGKNTEKPESPKSTNLDLIFLENVGNLVCPAEFDTGATKNVMILSVPEGDDKPLKYPLMFSVCDVLLINKIDTLPYFDFDLDACEERAKNINPHIEIFPISAKTGEGMEAWTEWLENEITKVKEA